MKKTHILNPGQPIPLFKFLALAALLSGCTSPNRPWHDAEQPAVEPEVAEAEQLFEQGYLRSFIAACVTPSDKPSVSLGLVDLQDRIARQLTPDVLEAELLFEKGKRQAALQACANIARKRPDTLGLSQLQARITKELAPEVAAAEQLFVAGQTQAAITACVDIARKNPAAVGLTDLQRQINRFLAEERLAASDKNAEATIDLHTAEAKAFAASPKTFRQKKFVIGENTPITTPLTEMQKALMQPIDLTLENADVNAIIAEIKKSTNINYIADSDIVSTKKITARFEKTPLIEMLTYFDKNLDINFSVCSNLVWITQKEAPALGMPPMETRVYRLRKGMVGSELGKSAHGVSLFKGPEERGNSSSKQEKEDETKKKGQIGLLESIERFIPQPEGADFLFNDKVHALIVKNTRENLVLVEELITAMDIRPLQILIEARFVTTSITDLRELGIDWLYQKPTTTTVESDAVPLLQKLQSATATGSSAYEAAQATAQGVVVTPSATAMGQRILSYQNLIDQQRTTTKDIVNTDAGSIGADGANIVHQFLLGDRALQATLHALESSGKSRTIVVPRVTTLNNREARFRVGEDTSYFEEVETDIMTSGSNNNGGESRDNVTYQYDTPTIVETGYSLIVTPSVGADLSAISMVLRPEISAIKEWKKYRLSSLDSTAEGEEDPAIEIPIISRQYIETEAVVRSGETVVLGGLADTSKNEESSGTPWLSNLPFIGWLFKTEAKNEQTKNILIFVTATLISDVGEELIPLNDFERYGLSVSDEAKVPDVLKEAIAVEAQETPPAAAAAPAAPPVPVATAPAAAPAPAPAP